MKKLVALMLVLCMVVTMLPMTLAADSTKNAIDYFKEPDYTSRPMARMWFGDGSSGEDENDTITKQINALAAAGFGGVEVTMLADSADYTNAQAKQYGWGSESWVKMIKKIFKAANAIEGGFEVDVTITGHWPATINTIDPNDPGASTELSYTITKVTAEDIANGKVNLELPETKTNDKGTDLGTNDKAPFLFTDTLVNSVLVKVESTEEKEVSTGGGGWPGGGGGFPGGDFPSPMSADSADDKETKTYYNLDFNSIQALDAAATGEGRKAGVPDKATADEYGWDYNDILEFFGPEPTAERQNNEKRDAEGNRYRMADWQDYYAADLPDAELTASEGDAVQAGDWVVVTTYYRGTGQLVSGGKETLMYNRVYAVNYFDEAGINEVTNYWNEKILDDELRALIKENGNAGIFEDSIEVSGSTSMWSYDLMQEVADHYGENYAYADALPAVMSIANASVYSFVNDDGVADRVQQDYNTLMGNLYEEQHCELANEWANSIGAQYRAQTYTLTGLDVAGAAATVNIPEGDNATKGDGLRLLSGAVNLYDKKYLSMEAITASQQYELNWETVLFELTANFSWGVNRAVFHGTPYSKNLNGYVADWPGWDQFGVAPLIFAESYTYREPYFEEMYMVGNYVARTQALLQYGTQKVDVAVVRDGAAVSNLGSGNSYQTLLSNGYSYNIMSEALLRGENAQKISNGKIYEDGPAYKAIILDSITTMSPDVMDVLISYAKAGIPIVSVSSNPSKVYGTEMGDRLDASVAEKYAELKTYDCVYEVESKDAALTALQSAGIKPYAQYEIANLETSHYVDKTDGTGYYYLYSTGGQTISPSGTSGKTYKELRSADLNDVVVTLEGQGTPYILDANTGDVTQATQYTYNEDGTISVYVGDIRSGCAAIVAISENYEDFPAPGAYVQIGKNLSDYEIVRNDNGTLALRSEMAGNYTLTMGDGQKLNVKVGQDTPAVDLTENTWTLILDSYGPTYDNASEMVDPETGIQTVDPSDTTITTHDFGAVKLGDLKDVPADAATLEKLGVTDMSHVSGKAHYTTTFNWDGDGAYMDVNYGHDQLTGLVVNGVDVAEVEGSLNNMTGIVDLKDYLVQGENTMTIEITTTLADRAFVESDTFANARRCTADNGLFGVTLNAYSDVIFWGADVTIDLTGSTEATVSDDLAYTVSVTGADKVATASVSVAIAAEPEVELADGWYLIAKQYENGILTVLAANNAGVTSEDVYDIMTLNVATPGTVGTFTVSITDVKLSAYLDDSETFVNAVLGNDTVNTVVDYSIYDVNCDGVVNQLDITRAQRAYGASKDDPKWIARADVNTDGIVDINDLILILNNYTK